MKCPGLSHAIRVQYSGFIVFAAQMLSVATGLVFTLLLTRNMTGPQFGIWSNIFDFTGYFTLLSGLFPFWVTRFVSRGKLGTVKTSFVANVFLASISIGIYLPLIFPIANAIHTEAYLLVYVVASLHILNAYLIVNSESCLRGIKPQAVGNGLLLEEAVKVLLALLLIVGFQQLFLGAMLSLTVSASVQSLYYMRLLFDELKQKVRLSYLKEWLKGSTAVLYNSVGNQLLAFVFILLFVYGGQEARADYQAATTFANIVGYSSSAAYALYPRLLVKNYAQDEVALSFRTVLMLAIPLSVITIVMAKSFLMVLNTTYGEAWLVLIVLTIDMLIIVVSQFYLTYVLGSEGLDAEGKISLRQLARSKILKVFTLPYLQAVIALPSTYIILTQLQIASAVEAVLYVAAINIGIHITTLFGLYGFMRKKANLAVAWRSVGKYVFASIVAASVLFLLPNTTTILLTIGKAAVGIGTYILMLVAIDKEARELVTAVFQEIDKSLGKSAHNNDAD